MKNPARFIIYGAFALGGLVDSYNADTLKKLEPPIAMIGLFEVMYRAQKYENKKIIESCRPNIEKMVQENNS